MLFSLSALVAHNRNRTDDLFLTKEVLYRLSYVGTLTSHNKRVMGIEPTLSAWKAEVLPLNYTRVFRSQKPDDKLPCLSGLPNF